jgi:hypothetical protein
LSQRRAQLDVRELQIAMNDVLLVRGFESVAICLAMGT